MAATLTVIPDQAGGRVQVAWTGATVGDTMTRDGLPVRYPPVTSTAGVLYDYEAQPGRTHTWALSGGQATGTLPAPDCDGLWLVHPTDPALSMKVKARWDQPQRWSAPGTVHEVMGNRPPIVTHTVRTYHSGQIEFWTPITAEADVVALFEAGTPILVNPPTCCTPVMRYEWTWGDLEAKLAGDDVTGRSGWWWTYSYQRIGTPAGHIDRPGQVANTYGAVLADTACHPDYASFLTGGCAHTDYADLLTTPHPHGATP
jgi:hypothetical protein